MTEREIEVGEGTMSKELVQPHHQLKQLVKRSIGIETELGEKSFGNSRLLVPYAVSFYLPNDVFSDPTVQEIVEDFSPAAIGSVPDPVIADFTHGRALVGVFDPDPDRARAALRQAQAVTFAVNPGTASPSLFEQTMEEFYKQFTKGLDTLRKEPEKLPGLLLSGEIELVREPLQLAVSDQQFADMVRDLHGELQGSWGVQRKIENRQGQRPKIIGSFDSLKANVDIADPGQMESFNLLGFNYLAVEPYHNLGPKQSIRPTQLH